MAERFKIVGYWSAPADPARIEEFERDYIENHVPVAAKLPGLLRLGTLKVADGWQGGTPEHHRIVEAEFESRTACEASFSTPEFAAMRADRQRLIDTYGVEQWAEVGELWLTELPGRREAASAPPATGEQDHSLS
ncbi:MAG TPA: EthD family reductase [Solirubrobacterales bacterium]|nr:EthD family reductase [Solirubrobacterales bacterium]